MGKLPDRNQLADQTSPYLLQHAANPVHWLPWGDNALRLAKTLNRPILLSIGYSACHWCHVMAHESFEDKATAAVMNELFVNIKVDREERPDLDRIYQIALQLLTQQPGGWPLTMFLAPDTQLPFFGGTYFPDSARHGMPAFADLLQRVNAYFDQHRDDIASQSGAVRDAFNQLNPPPPDAGTRIDTKPLEDARNQLVGAFDRTYGGFGRAPKFPHPANIERLLRTWRNSASGPAPDIESLFAATYSLRRMALGGIYDQLGGGFCRYSVDDFWMIPHFEKMLYDNGPLLALYAQAWRATGEGLFRRIARQTAAWVMREMQAPDGGYFSSLDADSQGEEGIFYVWDIAQINSALDDDEYHVFATRFGLNREANFEGRWHLHVFADDKELYEAVGLTATDTDNLLKSASEKLLAIRRTRIRPARDEKILASWNGLMIRGMAIAARLLDDADMAESAQRSLDFVVTNLWRDGRLLATARDGKAHLAAYLDDYAYLIDAIVELLQWRWRSQDLAFAVQLAEVLLTHFADRDGGGFFFTADDHERLIHRAKHLADDAMPSGNGVAALSLGRLGALLGDTRYLEAAEATVRAAWQPLQHNASAHGTVLHALEEILQPPEIVIVRGTPQAMTPWLATAAAIYAPRRLVFGVPHDAHDLPDAIALRTYTGDTVAYICRGSTCSPALTTHEEFAAALCEQRG